jgi:copper homeostasis protein CutC
MMEDGASEVTLCTVDAVAVAIEEGASVEVEMVDCVEEGGTSDVDGVVRGSASTVDVATTGAR